MVTRYVKKDYYITRIKIDGISLIMNMIFKFIELNIKMEI